MNIVREALAGTLESSDLLVRVAPNPTLELVIHSEVMQQFGAQIEAVVRETLVKLGIHAGQVIVEDKGALDCAIRARVQAAILRGAEASTPDWSVLT